jgi:type II secretory ATPase GspE/PulE/Tfp pilus assembly ATPase PilB-like protein
LITTTKVPSASVTSTQLAKVEAPTLEVKLPTESQVKQSSPPTAAAPAKPAMSPTVNNNIFYNAINEEVIHFERELAALRSRVNGITVQVSNIIMDVLMFVICHFTILFPVYFFLPSVFLHEFN